MEPNKITITIHFVENEGIDVELPNKDRIVGDIMERLENLGHNALLNVDTYDFIQQHRHQEYIVKHY